MILLCVTGSAIYILFLLQKKHFLQLRAIGSENMGIYIMLAINPDPMQGCQMQKLNGNAIRKLKLKEAKLLLKILGKMNRQFEYRLGPGK